MKVPTELVEQWRTEYYRSATTSYLPEYIAQRAAEWALQQPVSIEPDKRMKVKLGGTYGHELVGHWFYLHPADEFAEKALEDRTGIATQQPLSKEQCGYDETTGNCTRSSCCRAEPVSMEPVDWDQEIYSRTRTFIQTNEIEAIKEIAATQLAAARQQGADEERKKSETLRESHDKLKRMVDDGSINGRMYSLLLEQEKTIVELEAQLAGAKRNHEAMSAVAKSLESQLADEKKDRAYDFEGMVIQRNQALEQLAAQSMAYTTGHCAEKKKSGGCQLHNLQCGYPNCDRKPAPENIADKIIDSVLVINGHKPDPQEQRIAELEQDLQETSTALAEAHQEMAAARQQGAQAVQVEAGRIVLDTIQESKQRIAELEAASNFDHAEYKRLRGELEQRNAVLLEALKRIADEQNFFALGAARIIASEALAAEVKP